MITKPGRRTVELTGRISEMKNLDLLNEGCIIASNGRKRELVIYHRDGSTITLTRESERAKLWPGSIELSNYSWGDSYKQRDEDRTRLLAPHAGVYLGKILIEHVNADRMLTEAGL